MVNLREREELTTIEEILSKRKLIVIVYPNLKNIAGTRVMSDKVASFFELQNVTVLNIADLLGGFEASEITVNALDGRANQMANRMLAEHLFQNHFERFSGDSVYRRIRWCCRQFDPNVSSEAQKTR